MKRRPATIAECKCSWKRRFESERIARVRAAEAEAVAGQPIYVYRCPICKGWHLTKNAQGRHVVRSEEPA